MEGASACKLAAGAGASCLVTGLSQTRVNSALDFIFHSHYWTILDWTQTQHDHKVVQCMEYGVRSMHLFCLLSQSMALDGHRTFLMNI